MNQQLGNVNKYFEAQNAGEADVVASLFSDDGEVYNVNFPPVKGREGIKGFCKNLYDRTSARHFSVLETAVAHDVVMAEWNVTMTFRAGATVGPWQIVNNFKVELRGVNKFEFFPGTNSIKTLRIYHETSTVGQLAQANARHE